MKQTTSTQPARRVSKIGTERVPDEVIVHDADSPKYPDVTVQLTGGSTNAFAIMGQVTAALRAHGVDREEIDQFRREALSGNYDELIQTCMAWVEVE